MLKPINVLENADPKSEDIFNKDMLSTFYPERSPSMENMSLKDYVASCERMLIV